MSYAIFIVHRLMSGQGRSTPVPMTSMPFGVAQSCACHVQAPPHGPHPLHHATRLSAVSPPLSRFFAEQATDPNNPNNIERDDFALELAMLDE